MSVSSGCFWFRLILAFAKITQSAALKESKVLKNNQHATSKHYIDQSKTETTREKFLF